MGFMCSWIAIRTAAKDAVLDHLGMVETGMPVQPASREKPMSVHQSADGWLYIFAEDFEWADPWQVQDLSRFGLTLGVQFEDKIDMTAIVRAAENGRELWSVSHVNDPDHALDITGQPPAELDAIRRKYEKMQAEEDDDDVDYLQEIPLELARSLSGYRVDEDAIDFIALRGSAAPAEAENAGSGGLLARVFGLFKAKAA
jgi:hypothetical protein